jgi:mono/diheme cytochrome c family protein
MTGAVRRLACLTVAMLAGGALAAAGPRSAWSGVYTDDQATAGEQIYYAKCSSCHGDELGGIERAPALAGPQFLDSWRGRHLRRLLDRIDDMPPGQPKSLPAADAVAVLSFLLRSSGMPSGPSALPADRAQLGDITIDQAP